MRSLLAGIATVVIALGSVFGLRWGILPQGSQVVTLLIIVITLIAVLLINAVSAGARSSRSALTQAAPVLVAIVVIALIIFFGLVWFGVVSPDEVWRLVALPLAVGVTIVILQLLVEALVNRMRGRRG